VITCHKKHLLARCAERGYRVAEVLPCVMSMDGDEWTIDETHAAYPAQMKQAGDRSFYEPQAPSQQGPGTELKRLLSRVGIYATANCACNARAAQMDRWGCDESEKRLDEIVGWLQEEHAKRAAARQTILPFSKLVAANIVKLAIRRARRKESTGPN